MASSSLACANAHGLEFCREVSYRWDDAQLWNSGGSRDEWGRVLSRYTRPSLHSATVIFNVCSQSSGWLHIFTRALIYALSARPLHLNSGQGREVQSRMERSSSLATPSLQRRHGTQLYAIILGFSKMAISLQHVPIGEVRRLPSCL